MSYQVLARKWRPKTFREMAGQGHVLKALVNALDHDRLHHAYLFTGTRGVGKTTVARIFAKCLNCETGVSSEPCGSCDACVAINEGRFVDLIEVDAASKTKVDDTRELLENVQYAPTRGRYKVYLIDEVHMLSGHSFNALLKTLEEPPPHVKFMLATTDPQKIPATILSRCLQFSLKNMTPERIVEHVKGILDQEMVSYEEPALWLLARAAQGSMRDALSLTDQGIAFGSGKLLEEDIKHMLGTIDLGGVYELLEALAAVDASALLAGVSRLAELGVDFSGVLEELLNLLHRVALAQAVPDALDNSLGDRARVLELAARLSAEDVQYYYQMGLAGRRDLPLAPDARSGFEMVLLRMLAFRPQGLSQLPEQELPTTSGAAGGERPAPAKKPVAPEPSPAVEPRAVEPPLRRSSAPEPPAPVAKQPAPAAPHAPALAAEPPKPARERPAEAPPLAQWSNDTWCEQFDRLGLPGMLGSVASHCSLQSCSLQSAAGQRLDFTVAAANANLLNDSHIERLQQALSQYFGSELQVGLTLAETGLDTPAAFRQRRQRERLAAARMALESDPAVQLLQREFDASIEDGSIEPVARTGHT